MRVPSFLLTDRVQIEPSLGNTGDGDTYDVPFELPAYVERNRATIRDRAGRDHKVSSLVILRPTSAVKLGDRITVDGVPRIVRQVASLSAGRRESMVEVHAG
jgi:hypothetical protein